MNQARAPKQAATAPSFVELFTPKLVTVFREGYGWRHLRADALAGLTVAIVALPLSMAIAIASGVPPDRGLFTAIIGGFLVSAFGGSRFQIGGPAGAFIVLVAATVHQHGIDGLLLATFLSGLFMIVVGLLRVGGYIKFIPYPVTVGFTAGIALIILASQVKDLLGLELSGEPGPIMPKIAAIAGALPTTNGWAVAVAASTIGVILAFRRWRPGWPGMLIAVALATVVASIAGLPVRTIASQFGELASLPPLPSVPSLSWDKIVSVLPNALSFTLLGAIESLLSAVVADGMTGRRHRSNCELVAQGIANVGSSLFGGFCVTGTIARTATNVRAGAQGPVSGMLHALFLLIVLAVAAPVAGHIPLAALAGVLAVVAWNMVEKHAMATLLRVRGDAVVLLATLIITVFRDLTEGILVGFGLGTLLFLHRMSQAISVERQVPTFVDDRADTSGEGRTPYDPAVAGDAETVVYRISGAFFFGAAATVAGVLDRITSRPKRLVLDFANVPFIDSTGGRAIAALAAKTQRDGTELIIAGTLPAVRRELIAQGLREPGIRFVATLADAADPTPISPGSGST
jgi:SulP family sulfate permease